jgi:RNA recognition motif-containing protein
VDQDKIESIEIPKNNDSNYLRGYVFVVFENVSAANIAVEQFNKARFQGRRMIARPTREDAEVEEPTEPSVSHESSTWADSERSETSVPTTPSRRRDDGRRRNEKPQRSKNKGTSSTGSDKKKTTEKKSSSSRKTSGSQVDKKLSSKKASTEKKINVKDGKPVIADGTSHHHDKH